MFHTQTFEKFGKNDTAYWVYTVNSHTEISFLDSFNVYQVKSQYAVDMFLIVGKILAIRAQVINIGIVELFSFGDTKYLITFRRIQKLTMFIQ